MLLLLSGGARWPYKEPQGVKMEAGPELYLSSWKWATLTPDSDIQTITVLAHTLTTAHRALAPSTACGARCYRPVDNCRLHYTMQGLGAL